MNKKFSFSNIFFFLGLFFLYLPMLMLIIYSFNASKLVTVWSGFSVHWYWSLFQDEQLLKAVSNSIKVAFMSANMAIILGTITSIILVKFRNFKTKSFFSGMVTSPLIMPDVITGISLLLLFIGMNYFIGWPVERGLITLWIAHTTFCIAYATVIISSRLREVDLTIEEAAMDLGATPIKIFFYITLPNAIPALVAAWLLAFSLSLDDLVISSFIAGPNATTLPMLVFSSARLGVSPKINALATIIILIISLVSFFAWWLLKSRR